MRRPLVNTGVIAIPLLGVAAYFVYGRGFVNADIMWALSWGDELAQLRQPSFTAAGTPTPHPLVNFATALLSPLGQGAERAWHVIGYLSIGALLYATWGLGTTLFGRWAGLLAAALVATRATVVFYGPLAYLDLPYTALLIWALVLEARRPRRGTPVLVILAIAGLLRPEAWILAGLYWLWLLPAVDRSTAWRALMLVTVAPVLWALADLVATGDPMFSFTHTTHGSVEARPHGVIDLITQGPRLLAQEARPAVVAIAAVDISSRFATACMGGGWSRGRLPQQLRSACRSPPERLPTAVICSLPWCCCASPPLRASRAGRPCSAGLEMSGSCAQ